MELPSLLSEHQLSDRQLSDCLLSDRQLSDRQLSDCLLSDHQLSYHDHHSLK